MRFGNETKVTLHFIRHGQTKANEDKLYCGFTDIGLSHTGVKKLLNLKKEINYPIGELYINSGLTRCIQTMNLLYDNPAYCELPSFKEMNFGKFEMRGYEELKSEQDYLDWITNIDDKSPPEGESWEVFLKRIVTGLSQIHQLCRQSNVQSAVIVTHGGVIAVLMEQFFQKQKNFYEWQPENGRGYTIEFKGNHEPEYRNI